MRRIAKIMLRLIVMVIQIPLTIIYFIIGAVGSLLSGAGWLIGIILFGFALLLFIFGEFDSSRQMAVMVGVAGCLVILPEWITTLLTEGILGIKGFLSDLAG